MDKKQVDIYSLSPMQEAMLFHSLYDRGNSYFKQLVIQVEGDFHPWLFEKSLNVLIERYDIFRTVFIYKKLKKPRQVVLQERKAKIQYQDFSHLSEDERKHKVEAWIKKDQTKPFDLSKDLLLRVSVLKTGAQQYQIVFSSHHILLDGWCMGIVFEDLFEIYGKLKNHEPVPHKKVTQYRELIRWLEKQNPKETEQYWKQYLAGYEGNIKVPGAKNVYRDEYQLEEVYLSLDESLTKQLNQLAREHHLTLNNVFQTIWGLMLQRYNNVDDVVFGSVVSGRNKDIPGIQEIVGLFINTIPVRIKGSGEDRFIDLAKRVQQEALSSEPYDYVSLTDIQEVTQFGESLFDHIVVFENYVFDTNIFHKYQHQLGFVVTDARNTFEKTNYDFNVIVIPGEKLTILFQYNGHVYKREDVESYFRHFEHIVRKVIEKPDRCLKEIELVTQSEKQQLLKLNQTDADYPREKTIQEIFEEQVEKSPHQIALKFREKKMTYQELNEQANQLARVLRKQGMKRGQIVGLMTERSFEMMIGMLAIIKAGGAYMPIDPEYPNDRKEFMLNDAKAPVLLVQPGLEVPSCYDGNVIKLSSQEWMGEDKANLENVNQADDLLYVMYTSGSTGKPKGILTMHYNVMRTVINNGYIKVNSDDRLLQLSNYCFDGSTFDIYNAWLNGATLVLVPKEASKDFAELTKLIRKEAITVAFMTTSLFNTIVDLDLNCLKDLRKVVFGGEKASVKHVQKAVKELGEHRLINGYGPTETTVFAATYSIDQSVLTTHRVPIGKPLSNTRLYVLDQWGHLQPTGVPGELCISGDGVAKAYLNRPDLNETRFVPDPFYPNARMYRTGDLVRLLPDGHLEYIERMDDQVKIRGHRIEIGEVEMRLFAHPDVMNAVVLADKDENGHSYLCAYVVLEKDVPYVELREHMSEVLPDYMVPDYFVKMDQLPFTPNGKVDHRALPKPLEVLESKQEYVAPTNPVEEKLAKVWQEVLDVDQVGIHDNFFDLGGHSLKAMMLSSRVNKEFNADLPLREIFSRPTVHQQAAFLQDTGEKEYTEITPAPEMENYPVTSAQKRLYMVGQLEGTGTSYNMPYVFRVHGNLSVPHLEKALQALVDRHESLRTSFHMMDGELRQKVHPDADLVVEHYEADGKLKEKRVIQEFIRPFDLKQAPLMRAGVLYRTDTNEMYLLLDFHHIVADGVSIRQLFHDFSQWMQGEKWPSLSLQYKDYAYWQQNEKRKDDWKKHEEYWLNELSGELPVLQLPTDFPRPKVQRFDGDQLTFELDAGLSDQLRQLVDDQNATIYMVLLAAYNILLAKYSGQEDLIVGSPIAGRPHADLESIVGMFANTLAVRNQPKPELTFAQFVGQMKERILEMAEHQDYPFEELVEKLGAERDLSRNPLFDTMFSLQKNEMPTLEFADFSLELVEWDWKKSKFDMSWIMIEEEKIRGIVEYSTRLYKMETIKRMTRHYLHILKQVVENPDLRLAEIKLSTPDEEQKVLQTFNLNRLEYPRGRTIPTWFEEQVAKRPDQVALVCGEEKWTYHELNRQANRLAHALRKKGIGHEQLVGILMSPSKEMMAAILGVLKAGAAYVPIDPQYPADRIQYMLKDSGASLLFTDRPATPGVSGVEVWNLNEKDFSGESDDNPSPVNEERDLAYVIYTSGSTGKPKGVMVEHASLINLCEWHIHEFQVTPEDKSIKYAGVGFDASVWEIFPTWIAGAALYIIEEAMRYDLEALNQYMEEQGITIAFLPTPVAEQFMQLENHSLRILLTGGDRLGRVLPQSYTVVNNYGPTENTVVTTSTPVRPDEKITIGKPIANNQVYVLNDHQQLQPIGVPGELCISGESLARGYLNRPELTKEKFVPNPYVPGQRMYRTGDLVRWLPDGTLEFLGRMDDQVKIRGYRIELGEVASRLLEHASIREAFVTVQHDSSQAAELCAYFVASAPCSTDELRRHMSLKLPDYMVPVHFVEMEKLPLTRNGKVDKKALPAPQDAETTEKSDAAPTNPTEEQLINILKEILHTEQIGIHDSFFERGGNSLKGMMLSAQVHKRMHVELPLREIFARPVVKEMAAYIQNQKTAEHVTISPAPKQAYYPVSSAQKRLYVVGQLEGMGTGYNMPHAFHIQGELSISRLEKAFQALVERHESLRTSFHLIDGELMQKIHTDVKVQIECYQAQDHQDVKQKIQQFIRPFDLEKAPLIRVGMIEYAQEEEHVLVIDMHHIISDGVSMNILFQDLMKCMQGESLPPVSLQYKDYAVWQQNEKRKDAWKKHEQYWVDELSGELPVLDLPTDYPRPAVQRFDGDQIAFEIDPQLTRKLKRLVDEKKATPYMALLAAYNLLLAKYTGKNDIIVGSPIAGRSYAGLESMVGMFANTLVVRNRIDPKLPFTSFLEQVKERVLRMYEHQDYPFEELVEKLEAKRDLSRNPLFDTMFAMQNIEMPSFDLQGLKIRQGEIEWKKSKFDLSWMIAEEETLKGVVEYSTCLFKPETIQRMIRHFIHILRQIVDEPEIPLCEIELATLEEKWALLQTFNANRLEYPRGRTIPAWFEEQAAKRPDQVALVCGEEKWTYHELNRQANRLAHALRKKGIGREQLVGILMSPSKEMMAAILGVLKAGAAYVPIDPQYPADRIQYMLKDSGASLLFTDRPATPGVSGVEVWNLNEKDFSGESDDNPSPVNEERDLAYVIYTSGSTGKPKGVMVEHASLINLCEWHIHEFQVTPEDKSIKYAGVGFDASVWEIFPTWMAGAALYIIEEAMRYDLEALNQYMEEQGITIAFLPTPVAEQFMQLENHSLRILLTGGDRLGRVLPQSYTVVNNYGPTENTVVTTSTPVRPDERITIGKPIANNQVYVLNDHQQLQPIGVPGELCISGESLARGYLNRPELTKEKFVPNPYVPGQRMYRTGDLVRWLPDGTLEFLGRMDDQVKIRGYRIELGEVANKLLSYPTVKEAVVVAQTDERNQRNLCAYFTASESCSIPALRQYLGKELPDYMIPAYFMQMEQLPLNANGKVDQKMLPKPKQMKTGIEYAAPSNEKERILVKLWQEILHIEQVGVYDQFFELGGDSIKAMQIASRLKQYQLKMRLKDLFQHPTIVELAPHIQPVDEDREEHLVTGEVALTPIQHWMFEQTDYPDQWNMAIILHRKQGWEASVLKPVFQELVTHHDALRMSYKREESRVNAFNRGLEGEFFTIHEFDVNSEELSAVVKREATRLHQSIRINDGPLIRLGIFHTNEGDYLLIIIHHLVMDAVSWRVLSEDLNMAYQQQLAKKRLYLPQKTTSLKTWSHKLQEYANSPALLEEIPYWKEVENFQAPKLPVDKGGNPDYANKHIDIVWGRLPKEDTRDLLSEAHRAYQTEMNDLLLSGLVMTLNSWTYGKVAVQLEGHGREEVIDGVDLTRTIGWFTSMYPVVFEKDSKNPAEVIPYVKETLRRVPNKGIGYGILKYLTHPKHKQELSFGLKPEINFNYQGEFVQDVEKEDIQIVSLPVGEGVHPLTQWPYKLDFSLFVENGELLTLIRYHKTLYHRETIEQLKNHYLHHLKRIVDFCRENILVK